MKRHQVQSSTIASFGYDADRSILEIEFKNARIYRYFVVPAEVIARLRASESKGQFYLHEVRDKYPYQEVTD